MPLTGTNKVNKQPLRVDRWETDDPVFWQPQRGDSYRAMTAADVQGLRDELEEHGR
jgi:hypothetical protein